MAKNNSKLELLKLIRSGIRLKTKPPKVETPKSAYSRKKKYKRSYNEDSSFFIQKRIILILHPQELYHPQI